MPRDATSILVLRLLKNAGSQPALIGPVYLRKAFGRRDKYLYMLRRGDALLAPAPGTLDPSPGTPALPFARDVLEHRGVLVTRDTMRRLVRRIIEVGYVAD